MLQQNAEIKTALILAARALDQKQPNEARKALRDVPLIAEESAYSKISAALWKRIALESCSVDLPTIAINELINAFSAVNAAVHNEKFLWNAYEALPKVEKYIGPVDATALVASSLWSRIVNAKEGFFLLVFELFYRGGNAELCRSALEQYLRSNRSFVPTYWTWLLFTRTLPKNDHASVAQTMHDVLSATNRTDLVPLISVYLQQSWQKPVSEIVDGALALADPAHRACVADGMIDLGYMPDDLPIVVKAFAELRLSAEQAQFDEAFMQARLANAQERWGDAIQYSNRAAGSIRHRFSSETLRAHALAHLGEREEARRVLNDIRNDQTADIYKQSRATFVQINVERLEAGLPPLDKIDSKMLSELPGRPLAQSLWVGPKLRWIERLAIRSYLQNGWRFQLYVYDLPKDVPEGCEILDASAIIPEKEVFREGRRSGVHAGSLGAFSDLFRYRLLYERGGMWTDTDVINFRKFDPDGQKFICTELSDAGVVSLNGAVMAAPAHDPFMGRAYERSSEILASDKMVFTRIGPFLLAELLLEAGPGEVELMRPGFLSPINWMNTGSLLQSYDTMAALPTFKSAVNLHVYTEMWRLLGLGLDAPPPADTFLGRLYDDHFGENTSRESRVA